MSTWITFKELREELDFEAVLKYYNVILKSRRGDQRQGFCPLPNHPPGKKSSPAFSVNLAKKLFQCFNCGARGNILDFCVLMERGNPRNGADVRKVALDMAERFSLRQQNGSPPRSTAAGRPPKPKAPAALAKAMAPVSGAASIINAPLDFELKGLDPNHPWFSEHGLSPDTVRHFGLGYCSRGMLKGYIGIPVRDVEGRLVAYIGRLADDRQTSHEQPTYKFPPSRLRNDQVQTFDPKLVVYNLARAPRPLPHLVLVEDVELVWRLWQAGFPHVAATLDHQWSDAQRRVVEDATAPQSLVLHVETTTRAVPAADNGLDRLHRATGILQVHAASVPHQLQQTASSAAFG